MTIKNVRNQLNIDKSEWRPIKLGDVVEEKRESVSDPEGEGLERIVGLEHIESENIHLKSWGDIANGTSFSRRFRKGQLLFGRRRPYLKKAAYAGFDGVCSGDIIVMQAKRGLIPELMPFLISSDRFFDYAIKNSAGSLSPRVKFKDLAKYEFLMPPKKQQTCFAELLWAADEVVEAKLSLYNGLLIFYSTAIEKELLTKEGPVKNVSNFGFIIRGVGYKPEDLLSTYDENSCIILRANNIADSRINYDDIKILSKDKVKEIQFLVPNDFAICMSNGSKELVGKTAKFTSNQNNISIGSFCAIFRPYRQEETDILEHFFLSETYRQTIKRVLTGSSINNLKPNDIEGIKFKIIDSKNDLKTILLKLKKMRISIDNVIKNINDSKRIQKSIINQIF